MSRIMICVHILYSKCVFKYAELEMYEKCTPNKSTEVSWEQVFGILPKCSRRFRSVEPDGSTGQMIDEPDPSITWELDRVHHIMLAFPPRFPGVNV